MEKTKEAFKNWYNGKKKFKFTIERCISCLEKSSLYACSKQISKCDFYEIQNWKYFKDLRIQLFANKEFKHFDKDNFRAFKKIGKYYSLFLKEFLTVSELSIKEDKLIVEEINQNAENVSLKPIEEPIVNYINWNKLESYEYTKPIYLEINKKKISVKNWAELLVNLCNYCIKTDEAKNIVDIVWNGSKRKLWSKVKEEMFAPKRLEAGFYVETNFSASQLVSFCAAILKYYEINSNDCVVAYCKKEHAKDIVNIQNSIAFDDSICKAIKIILINNFSNGYKLESAIEMRRFKKFLTEENTCIAETLNDEEIKNYILHVGIKCDKKVYAYDNDIENTIHNIVQEAFDSDANVVFFEEIFWQNENWLISNNILSEQILAEIIKKVATDYVVTNTYVGTKDYIVTQIIKQEILRVWGDTLLLTYDELKGKLKFVPIHRIKQVLCQDSYFICNRVEEFSTIEKIFITEEQENAVYNEVLTECETNGYASLSKLDFSEILNNNLGLTISGVHNFVYQKFLHNDFDKKGKILMKYGCDIDAYKIMKDYCSAVESCTVDELITYEEELTGEVHRWIPMEAAYSELVRINIDNFVSEKFIDFEIEAIDKELDKTVVDEYLPLREVSTFALFPNCGYAWNLFLLESYCRRFSQKFKFEAPAFNSKNVGVIIRKESNMAYLEIMADAIAKSECEINKTEVLNWLYEKGYIGRRSSSQIEEIMKMAVYMRERR